MIRPQLCRRVLAAVLCGLLGACTVGPPAPVVYKSGAEQPAPAAPRPQAARSAPAASQTASRPPVPHSRPPQVAASQGAHRHRVEPGDSVYGLARRYGVPIRDIILANALAPPYTLQVGQAITLPAARYHTVQPGETVYSVSRAFDVDMRSLVRLNSIPPPYVITVGQVLKLPGELVEEPSAELRTAAVETAPLPPPGRPAQAEPAAGTNAPGPEAPPPPAARPASEAALAAPLPASRPAAPDGAARRVAVIPTPPPRHDRSFAWPVQGRIVSRFGPKEGGRHNDGLNIAAPAGTPILAAENGVVVYVGNELKGFGNLLLIRHADGWMSAYAHAQRVLVSLGETVSRGQTVARVGQSGSVSAPQLHFELRQGTTAVDPLRHLTQQATGPSADAAAPG